MANGRRFWRRRRTLPVSWGHTELADEVPPALLRGWQAPEVAERQHQAFVPLLQEMYAGRPREDFIALASAVAKTGMADPLIVEVGCGSGWNQEVLAHLLRRPIRYVGVDYAPAMVSLAKRHALRTPFVAGEATALPFRDHSCDILLSGTVLMHLLDYPAAIRESRRVSRAWCIFHTVPVLSDHRTTRVKKWAYGQPVFEVLVNEAELLALFTQHRLVVRHVLPSLPYSVQLPGGVRVETTSTYVCECA